LSQFFYAEEPYRGHVREYTASETKELLRNAHFEEVNVTTVHSSAMNKRLSNSQSKTIYKLICRLFPNLREEVLAVGGKPPDWSPSFLRHPLIARSLGTPDTLF